MWGLGQLLLVAGALCRARGAPTGDRSLVVRGAFPLIDAPADDSVPTNTALFLRFSYLSVVFSPVTSTAWLAALSPHFRRHVWYIWLRIALGNGGAAFIKWAQWSATRADLFPEALCVQFGRLQADAPRHGFGYTRREVEACCGAKIEAYFDGGFDRRPVASGSIAQVHFARKGGLPLAVKVRHPRVAELMRLDTTLMVGAASLVDRLPALRWLRLPETVAQFSDTLAAQSRLDVEAGELARFGRAFAGRRWRDIRFPRPVKCSDGVLIESFEAGRLVNSIVGDARRGCDGDAVRAAYLVQRGEDIYLKMLLDDGVVHADLHPGNLLYFERDTSNAAPFCVGNIVAVTTSQRVEARRRPIETVAREEWATLRASAVLRRSRSGRGRTLTLVDAGMVATLTRDERENFIGLLESIGAADARTAARCIRAFSPSNAVMTRAERNAFDKGVKSLFDERCRGYDTGVEFGNVVRGILQLVRAHQVRINANYATLIVNALCLDGMAADLLPSYSVLDAAKPLLSTHRWLCGSRFLFGRSFGRFFFRRFCLPIAWRFKRRTDAATQSRLARRIAPKR